MAIIRGPRPTDRFTQVSNDAAQDNRMTYKARGILTDLLSRPVGWSTSADRIAARNLEGRDAIRAGLAELERFGYLVRQKRQDESGRWVHDQVVTDQPATLDDESASSQVTDISAGQTRDGLSVAGSPDVGSPDVGKPVATTKKEGTKKELERKNPSACAREAPSPSGPDPIADADEDMQFTMFWNRYPNKIEKRATRFEFRKAIHRKAVPPKVIINSARDYRNHCRSQGIETRFQPSPAKWLREERWNDEYRSGRRFVSAYERMTQSPPGVYAPDATTERNSADG